MAVKLQKASVVNLCRDLLKSVQTTDQTIILAFNLIAMLKEGAFHLTRFLGKRREVLSAFPSQSNC